MDNNNAVAVVLELHGKIDRKCPATRKHIQYISSRNSCAPVQNKCPETESFLCTAANQLCASSM